MLLKKSAGLIAYGGIAAALGLLLLYGAFLLPTGKAVPAAISSLIPLVFLKDRKVAAGFSAFAATALLAVLLIPDLRYGLFYTLVAGAYPFVRHACEHFPERWQVFLAELLFGEAALALLFVLFRFVFALTLPETPWWILALAAQVCIPAAIFLYEWAARLSVSWMERLRLKI